MPDLDGARRAPAGAVASGPAHGEVAGLLDEVEAHLGDLGPDELELPATGHVGDERRGMAFCEVPNTS